MRRPLVAVLPALLLANACSVHRYVNGSVSYATSPPLADHSGALPLQPLLCVSSHGMPPRPNAVLTLGDRCRLSGWMVGHGGKGVAPTADGVLAAEGTCELPTATGPLPIQLQNTAVQIAGGGLDVTLGGTTPDHRYMTWRFTGMLGEDAPGDTCDALLGAAPDIEVKKAPPPPKEDEEEAREGPEDTPAPDE